MNWPDRIWEEHPNQEDEADDREGGERRQRLWPLPRLQGPRPLCPGWLVGWLVVWLVGWCSVPFPFSRNHFTQDISQTLVVTDHIDGLN